MARAACTAPREERVASRCAPAGSSVVASDNNPTSAPIWAWFIASDGDTRAQALTICGAQAVLLAHLADVSAHAPPGQTALFEWKWIEHQFTTLLRKKGGGTRTNSRPGEADVVEEVASDGDENGSDTDPLRREVAAGRRLLAHTRLFSLDRSGAWDGATLEATLGVLHACRGERLSVLGGNGRSRGPRKA